MVWIWVFSTPTNDWKLCHNSILHCWTWWPLKKLFSIVYEYIHWSLIYAHFSAWKNPFTISTWEQESTSNLTSASPTKEISALHQKVSPGQPHTRGHSWSWLVISCSWLVQFYSRVLITSKCINEGWICPLGFLGSGWSPGILYMSHVSI